MAKYVENCIVLGTEKLVKKSKGGEMHDSSKSSEKFNLVENVVYRPVHCNCCGTEVGIFEERNSTYHLFNIIPGNG